MLRFFCTGKPEDASLLVPWGKPEDTSLFFHGGDQMLLRFLLCGEAKGCFAFFFMG
ncbi:hypothetical protein MC7420_6885 [Coleofasciculus chthonoplastes PCC 7420]|uniref:Uncharacterized protein n=1 Tax=Coleofasciculus chthonoplastes PCC 7420 TaxID=118168 RepID=B4W1T1_9CYAN|nr:hypothetical protein MC7420_6885 [Coleofasciculus chthonoplastes PCC 7420]